ncbi:MAG: hypothetical protein JNL83_17630 [Myxococcales bacterium]|nr:hypothetical protein [Myxococcales bacterium]
MLVPPSSPPSVHRALVLGSMAAALSGVLAAGAVLATRPSAPALDPCRPSVDIATMTQHHRTVVARWALACSDLTHGRITQAQYDARSAAIDAAWTAPVAAPEPVMVWAATVRGFSSQYSEASWSAQRVLGAPDVYPQHGDLVNAWASRGADDADEWIEVGFAQATRASAIELYETFNPGAVSEIELVTASGNRITAYQGSPAASGPQANKLRVELACSDEPIVAVNVRLGSRRVVGWNEIDAIGLQRCP